MKVNGTASTSWVFPIEIQGVLVVQRTLND
jgi:hypothetical protein